VGTIAGIVRVYALPGNHRSHGHHMGSGMIRSGALLAIWFGAIPGRRLRYALKLLYFTRVRVIVDRSRVTFQLGDGRAQFLDIDRLCEGGRGAKIKDPSFWLLNDRVRAPLVPPRSSWAALISASGSQPSLCGSPGTSRIRRRFDTQRADCR